MHACARAHTHGRRQGVGVNGPGAQRQRLRLPDVFVQVTSRQHGTHHLGFFQTESVIGQLRCSHAPSRRLRVSAGVKEAAEPGLPGKPRSENARKERWHLLDKRVSSVLFCPLPHVTRTDSASGRTARLRAL